MRIDKKKSIAIVGMALRLPGNIATPHALWNALEKEQNLVSVIDRQRWCKERYLHPNKNELGKSYTFAAGVLPNIYQFDANFFGISPREAQQMDPQQRLLLETTWEALENGNQNVDKIRGSNCAVYVGVSGSDNISQYAADSSVIDTHSMLGNSGSIAANRISYFFDLHGPSISIDTACSSSMVAMHEAFQSILQGDAETAIVGGVNVFISPTPFIGFSKANMLSPDGLCKSFDADGNGYVRSEGCVVLFLKPLLAAEKAQDPIQAIILNTGVNSDGRTNGIALPSASAQAELMRRVHKKIQLQEDDISYLEAHGTGTFVGDPIEASAINQAISAKRSEHNPLLIGSIKSNLGHLEVASGLAGIAKAVLCLQKQVIPASLHFKKPNPAIDFDNSNLKVVDKLTKLTSTEQPHIIAVNSFGFGGTNAHVVLAEYQSTKKIKTTTENTKSKIPPLIISAHNEKSLKQLARLYSELIRENTEKYYDIAYTAAYRRSLLKQSAIVEGADPESIVDKLKEISSDNFPLANVIKENTLGKNLSVVLVYSGNGSQWQGMAQTLLKYDAVFKKTINEIDLIFSEYSDFSIKKELKKGNNYHLTEIAQPCLFAIQVAVTNYLLKNGLRISAVFGHSVGEVAAAWACGALTLKQAVRLIYVRSSCQGKTSNSGCMTAVSATQDEIQKIIANLRLVASLEVAAINSADSVTVSGKKEAIEVLEFFCQKNNIFYRRLDINYAFHSQYMDVLKQNFLLNLKDIKPHKNSISFISTVTGKELAGDELTGNYWWQNIRQPVDFYGAVKTAISHDAKIFIEIGPKPVVTNYLKQTLEQQGVNALAFSTLQHEIDEKSSLKQTLFKAWLGGAQFNYNIFFTKKGHLVNLPNHPWNRETYRLELTNENSSQFQQYIEHPLLGWRNNSEQSLWENHLDPYIIPYLSDHQIDNVIVLPGAAYAEMAFAAAKCWYKNDKSDLRDLEILAPMVFDSNSRIVHFCLQDSDGSFEIMSRARHTSEKWVTHAKGRIINGAPFPEKKKIKVAFRSIKSDIHQQVSREEFYQRAQELKLFYGPTFKAVKNVWCKDKLAYAETVLCDSIYAEIEKYCLHPILLDACFQLLISLFPSEENIKNPMLPVRFGRVRIFGRCYGKPILLAQISKKTRQTLLANFFIVNEQGIILAEITDCRFKRAELSKKDHLPPLYQYKPYLLGSHESTGQPIFSSLENIFEQVVSTRTKICEKRSTHFNEIMPVLDSLIGKFVYEGIRKIVKKYDDFSLSELVSILKITKPQRSLFNLCLKILTNDGFLMLTESGRYKWCESERDELDAKTIWRLMLNDYPDYWAELSLVGRCGLHLTDILRGYYKTENILDYDSNNSSLEYFLNDSPAIQGLNNIISNILNVIVKLLPTERRLQILEVGANFSEFTSTVVDSLQADKTEYTLLIQNGAGVVKANQFAQSYHFVKVVAVEDLDVVFENARLDSHVYDIVILRNCLHQTKDPIRVIESLKSLLSSNSVVLLAEQQPDRLYEFTLGIQPTWWKQQANEECLTRLSPVKEWQNLLINSQYKVTDAIFEADANEYEGSFVLLAQALNLKLKDNLNNKPSYLVITNHEEHVKTFVDLLSCNNQFVLLANEKTFASKVDMLIKQPGKLHLVYIHFSIGDEPDIHVCQLLLQISQTLEKLKILNNTQLTIVTQGAICLEGTGSALVEYCPAQAPLWGFVRVLTNELPDLRCKLIDLHCKNQEQAFARLVKELTLDDKESEIIITSAARYGLRILPVEIDDAVLKTSSELCLHFNQPGPLKNLQWFIQQGKLLDKDEVKIKPFASGLNFRDVMFAMGLIPEEALEDGFLGPTLGMEFAGEVIAVGKDVVSLKSGDRVMGFAPASFSTMITTKVYAVMPMPSQWSFADGASVPIAFFTAYYSLCYLARLQPGERLLIHGAAGGVGIAAIQLAKHLGAEIYATAGSEEKRDFLQLLGVKYIYDSRNIAFADQIIEATEGQGIDVVLNCLSGEAIQANFSILKPFGRFLELGKRDFYANSKIGLRPFRNNISYFGIDADQLIVKNSHLCTELFADLMKLFENNILKPIPYRVFAADNVTDAFRYMQHSKHIGKIIIDFTKKVSKNFAKSELFNSLVLSDKATYIVTGGLSGFGLRTAQWLAEKGAKYLVLASRSGILSAEAEIAIRQLKTKNVLVKISATDVSNFDAVQNLLVEVEQQMPSVKGIIHAAAVFDDSMINNLNAEKLSAVLKPKMLGAWNLHKATQSILLDFFIVYSSATTYFGNPGQANYVAANMYLESLIHWRRLNGLSGLYVAWGAIEDVGYLARNKKVKESLANKLGGRTISSKQALDRLEKLMLANHTGLAVIDLDFSAAQRYIPSIRTTKFKYLLSGLNDTSENFEQQEIDIRELIQDKTTKEAIDVIAHILIQEIARILHLSVSNIDPNQALSNMGLDSLMGAELANAVSQKFNIPVSVLSFSQGATAKTIAQNILIQISQFDSFTHQELSNTKTNAEKDKMTKMLEKHEQLVDQKILLELVGGTEENTR